MFLIINPSWKWSCEPHSYFGNWICVQIFKVMRYILLPEMSITRYSHLFCESLFRIVMHALMKGTDITCTILIIIFVNISGYAQSPDTGDLYQGPCYIPQALNTLHLLVGYPLLLKYASHFVSYVLLSDISTTSSSNVAVDECIPVKIIFN